MAVFAFGSVGNGLADDYSDLELGIIWSKPPEPETLKGLAANAGGADWTYDGLEEKKLSYCDNYAKDGLAIQCAHWTVTIIDGIIDDIMIRHDVSKNMLMYERQATAATLLRCRPLAGDAYLKSLRSRVANYPRPLAVAMIKQNLTLGPIDMFAMMAARGEIPLFFDHLSGRIRLMHSLLFALNSIYHPSFKWTRFFLRQAKIMPENFEARVDKLFATDLPDIVTEYQGLAIELFDLISIHFPEIDISEAVRTFSKPLPKWGLST